MTYRRLLSGGIFGGVCGDIFRGAVVVWEDVWANVRHSEKRIRGITGNDAI